MIFPVHPYYAKVTRAGQNDIYEAQNEKLFAEKLPVYLVTSAEGDMSRHAHDSRDDASPKSPRREPPPTATNRMSKLLDVTGARAAGAAQPRPCRTCHDSPMPHGGSPWRVALQRPARPARSTASSSRARTERGISGLSSTPRYLVDRIAASRPPGPRGRPAGSPHGRHRSFKLDGDSRGWRKEWAVEATVLFQSSTAALRIRSLAAMRVPRRQQQRLKAPSHFLHPFRLT